MALFINNYCKLLVSFTYILSLQVEQDNIDLDTSRLSHSDVENTILSFYSILDCLPF